MNSEQNKTLECANEVLRLNCSSTDELVETLKQATEAEKAIFLQRAEVSYLAVSYALGDAAYRGDTNIERRKHLGGKQSVIWHLINVLK